MGDLRKQFGKRLRELRSLGGLTQKQLADRARMDYKYIGALERAERNPTLFNIGRVADALGVGPAELLRPPTSKPIPQPKVDRANLATLLNGCDAPTRRKLLDLVKLGLRLAGKR